jgi:transcriptional regulator with XRE-family HTH domain
LVEPARDFAQQLKSLREAQGLSVRALAGLVGVSSVTIWKWEKGDSRPRPRLMTPLARALDVAPHQLRPPAARENAAQQGEPETGKQPESGIQTAQEGTAQTAAEPLADVIARAKQMIADASGTGPNNITILIEY